MTQIPIMEQMHFYLALSPYQNQIVAKFVAQALSICHGYQTRARDRSSILKLKSLSLLLIE